jgi:hypothetical protein
MMDDIQRQLLETERPEPPLDMRDRVLAATMPLVRPNDSRLDCIWFSRKWRIAGAFVLMVLVGCEAVSNSLITPVPEAQDRPAADLAETVGVAAIEVGLTPADAAALVEQAIELSQSTGANF